MGIFATPPSRFRPPHPPLSLSVFLIVEEAIRLAWVRIRQMDVAEFDLANAHEDTITQRLHEILFDEIYDSGRVEGFDDNLMETGTRETKYRNFNGTILDKMPDLHIGIRGRKNIRPSQDGVFIECKPVDQKHTAGAHYCTLGIARFVRGDYAWAMTNAMMVGYAAEKYTVEPKLLDALDKSEIIVTTSTPTACDSSQTILFSDQTYSSRHKRDFRYVETGKDAPDIVLRHLWLRR
ncbi:MAG: hypothetical protein IID44_06955 [Planctomycetes bacterium]|nr:hypothetical protein [Planctomycetota bacterium]